MGPLFITLTPNCFKVSFQYHPMLVKCIKRVPSARYVAEGRFWEVQPSDENYLHLMAEWAVRNKFCTSQVWDRDEEPVCDYVIPPMPKLEVPHNMILEPYEYQKEGIAYALEHKRCIMGDEPGLGKTAQAIGTMTASGAFPALVICPASLKVNWQREFKKFGGEKLIVFCFLKQVVAELKEEFKDAVTVTGDDNDQQKQYAVDSFQNDPGCKLIILNYRSGGTGLTLTAASNVLFVEFPWTYSDCCQAEDRAHRNGQKNAVTCTYLLGKDTIDEYMYNIIQTKKDIANGVTGTIDEVEEKKVSQAEVMMQTALDMFKGKI